MDIIPTMIEQVDPTMLTRHLDALCRDLPCRTLNHTTPGHDRCTLYEADAYITGQLESWGYAVEREPVQVQALRTDTSKPMPHQFRRPDPNDPWYTAYNVYAKKTGNTHPDEIIVVISHKDSQSWLDWPPGANDNAAGTIGNLEVARLFSAYASQRSVWFVYCNEEHTPWTSETAARNLFEAGRNVIAVINMDGIGGRAEEDVRAGRHTQIARYTTDEGEALAGLMGRMNDRYQIGLIHGRHRDQYPNDDDGSFVKAGIPAAVLTIGSIPYQDAAYHTVRDTADRVDMEQIRRATQLSLACALRLDGSGFPG